MIGEAQDAEVLMRSTVLYVEDEPETRELTAVFLGRRVGTLLTAADGLEGLAVFRESGAQIIVTDIRMPRMDGLAMAQEIRRSHPAVLVIVTTAFEDQDYLARALDLGIDHYVVKPIPMDRLEYALVACARRLRSAQVRADALTPGERQRLGTLTDREREVLVCIGRGLPAHETGQGLGISAKTVNTHLAHLMLKLGVHKSSALAAFAVRSGLI
jgi:DNA-binding NarL/FixJ family response regulator